MINILFILSSISLVFLVFSFTRKNNNFLNISMVIKQHLSFFKDNKLQFISIYCVPIVISLYISFIHAMTRDFFDTLVIMLSIFISMFFAVLSILCTINIKTDDKKYDKLLNETFTSTMFEIIVCLLLLFISFCAIFIGNCINEYIKIFGSFIIYYLSFILILNIFILIKRIEALFLHR